MFFEIPFLIYGGISEKMDFFPFLCYNVLVGFIFLGRYLNDGIPYQKICKKQRDDG